MSESEDKAKAAETPEAPKEESAPPAKEPEAEKEPEAGGAADKPDEQAAKPDEPAAKPDETAEKPAETAEKPAESAEKPAESAEPASKPDETAAVAPVADAGKEGEKGAEAPKDEEPKPKPKKEKKAKEPEPEVLPEKREEHLKIGFLHRYAAGLLSKGWKRNLVALSDGALHSYATAKDYGRKAAGVLHLVHCDGVTTYEDDKAPKKPGLPPNTSAENGFVVRISGKANYFVADTVEEAKEWLDLLTQNREKHYKAPPEPKRKSVKEKPAAKEDAKKPAEGGATNDPPAEGGATKEPEAKPEADSEPKTEAKPDADAKAEAPNKEPEAPAETKPAEPAGDKPADGEVTAAN